jgi:predicted XRE-type DNA-binding protein
VLEELKTKSQAQLAKEIGCPRSSINWLVQRYCSDAEQAGIKKERIHLPKDKIIRVTKEK